ncbi:MAG TPA: dodecin family protein [Candidatus Limnocylindria bacterium]|nr:dodecin family protein [Candidatus Limnocylindria bacterium]
MPAPRPKPAPGVIRLSEATGSSSRSWEDAVAAAVKASDVKAPVGVEVSRLWADWERGKLSRFHATVKVAYRQALKAPTRAKA